MLHVSHHKVLGIHSPKSRRVYALTFLRPIYKVTQEDEIYEIAPRSNNKTIVNPNVAEVGWDERYVVFKRKDGSLEEIGILDTKTKHVKTSQYNEKNMQELYTEFKIPKRIILQKVEILWPDTRHLR